MMCNEEAVKSTFDKYLFHLVKLGEIVQKCMKKIDEDIQEKDQIKVYNLLKGEFKELVKDINVVFNESFTIDKYNWILKFKERYLDFNKRYTDIAGRLDICALDDEAEDEDSIDITEEEARSDGGLEEEYLGTDEDEYEDDL
jgi:hypothetical protein